nr:immunoglobulin heavy chain junction region [Macaca mulatta]MOV36510.1 immunoglobulin heavy chain junction region [Macaca mulatta]
CAQDSYGSGYDYW